MKKLKIMKKILSIFVLCLSVFVFGISCDTGSSAEDNSSVVSDKDDPEPENPEPEDPEPEDPDPDDPDPEDPFIPQNYDLDKSNLVINSRTNKEGVSEIYIEWIEPENVDFNSIKITWTKGNKENVIEHSVKSEDFFEVLSKNVYIWETYQIEFKATDALGNTYTLQTSVWTNRVPQIIERATAIVVDDKTYVSWGLNPYKINEKSIEIAGCRIYSNGTRLKECAIKECVAYEEMADGITDNFVPYSKYYSCVIDKALPEDEVLQLSFVTRSDIESGMTEVKVKKVNLPVVNVSVDLSGTNFEDFKQKDKIDATLSVENTSEFALTDEIITIKGRGNSSWFNAPKKSYTIKFDSKKEFLGMKKHKTFVLVANYFDKTLLRNASAYGLAKNVFDNLAWTPNAKSVNLFINGVYQGVYGAGESVKIDKNRVAIETIEDYVPAGQEIDENIKNFGFVLEVNERLDEDFNFVTNYDENKSVEENNCCVAFSLKEPAGADIDDAVGDVVGAKVKNYVEDFTNEIQDKLYSEDFADPSSENYYGNYLDVDSFIDWWIVEEIAKNTDSNFFSSCYMYFDPQDQKLHMGPLWDFDLGFGNHGNTTISKQTGFLADIAGALVNENNIPYAKRANWICRLREDSAFVEKINQRWNFVRADVENYFANDFASNLESIKNDAELNFVRWPILGESVWNVPSGFETRTTYDSEIDYFNSWFKNRMVWLNSNF